LEQVNVEGTSIAYEARGKGDPVVFLHGWNSTSKQWLLNLKAFAPGLRVIAPDLPGFGESGECEAFAYTRDGMASFLEAFRKALHLPAIHVVGHSMGGCIAIRYTASHPETVRRLVLVSTPTRSVSMGLRAVLPGMECFISATYPIRNEDMLKWMFYRGLYEPEHQDLEFVRTNVKATARIGKRTLRESTRIVRGMDLSDDLASIAQPTLIVFGDRDKSVNPREAHRQQRLLPQPYLAMLTGCAHCPPYEKPELFNKIVLEFLQSEDL
jgi:pimeloyl-ACP methyl ester carboxylesterase